jgi:hypothetical protein
MDQVDFYRGHEAALAKLRAGTAAAECDDARSEHPEDRDE